SGFTALPAGYRDENGTFTGINRHANFTSSTKSGLSSAWYRNLYYYLGDASRLDYNLSGGFSVRCVKN
ncbi:MAG: hypothetical protein NTV01_05950, partial [Bacteroidia bacterium]|nr:hypothetical protein [Bacteroidia bacterium]